MLGNVSTNVHLHIGGNSAQLRWILQLFIQTEDPGVHLAVRRLLSVLLKKSILSGWGDETFAWLSSLQDENHIDFLVGMLGSAVTQPHRYAAPSPMLGSETSTSFAPSPCGPLLRCALEKVQQLKDVKGFGPALEFLSAVMSHIAHTSLLPRLAALRDWVAQQPVDISASILPTMEAILSANR